MPACNAANISALILLLSKDEDMDIKTSNIDDFNLLVGKIFDRLYGNFPVPTPIFLDVFFDDDTLEKRVSRKNEIAPSLFGTGHSIYKDENLVFFKATVEWLRIAGFISYDSCYEEGYDFGYMNVSLTNQALQCLNMVPGSLITSEHKHSQIGGVLRDAVKSGSTEIIKDSGKAALLATFVLGRTFLGM